MSYIVGGTTIRSPKNMEEQTVDQFAQQKALSGSVGRDYFGTTKRIWLMDYVDTVPADYTTIKTIVDSYKSGNTVTTKTFQSTEVNYVIALTNVHLDLMRRKFSTGGATYISDFTLVLTEA